MLAGEAKGLEHVTLIEEAHRLLTKTSTDVGAETANTKGQSVEAFCNILAEIRAYGEGLIVADQIPSKLASDVLKNTNMKIMNLMGTQKMAVTADLGQLLSGLARVANAARRQPDALPAALGAWRSDIKSLLSSDSGPWRGCVHCPEPCLYEPLGRLLADRRDATEKLQKAFQQKDVKRSVSACCRELASGMLFTDNRQVNENLAICFFAHVAEKVGSRDPAANLAYVFGNDSSSQRSREGKRPSSTK
jgi:hypothetical protein